jgi:uncharacterized protein YutE (UPF0331/DUF86 family)
MVNGDIILKKLNTLREYIAALRDADDITWERYEKNNRDRAFVERYLHIALQTVFDIANHIISYQKWKEPETSRESFEILASNGIFPVEKVPVFQNMASFRNLLVHHYDNVDNGVVFGIFKNRLGDFDLFMEYILEYLKKTGV